MTIQPTTIETTELRALLFELARREDELACDEAAVTPYWEPTPASVLGHRRAAAVLRRQADAFLAAQPV